MSYIPSLTLPSAVFNSPAISILLPVTIGLGSGFLSQPGGSKPKTTSDAPHPDRGTFRSDVERKYGAMKQPPLRPPPWIFAPVWTALYAFMGYASHRAWVNGMASLNPRIVEDTRRGATLYTIQLVLNQLFMPLFFGIGRPVEALADITALTGAVGYLALLWRNVDETASNLMIPYFAWCAFATYLTAGTGYLNNWDFRPFMGAKSADDKSSWFDYSVWSRTWKHFDDFVKSVFLTVPNALRLFGLLFQHLVLSRFGMTSLAPDLNVKVLTFYNESFYYSGLGRLVYDYIHMHVKRLSKGTTTEQYELLSPASLPCNRLHGRNFTSVIGYNRFLCHYRSLLASGVHSLSDTCSQRSFVTVHGSPLGPSFCE